MKKRIISLFLGSIFLLSNRLCFADDFQFNPVVQGIPDANSYSSQYPLPSQNYNQNHIPVNSYQTQQYNSYNSDNEYDDSYNSTYNSNYNSNYNTNYNANYTPPNNDRLQGNVVMVPANTTFGAVLASPLSSESAKLGDAVSMFLGSDFYYGQHLIAPAGSRIQGSIIKVKKGTYGNVNGQLQIKLTNIVTPVGQIIPISAQIVTNDGTGILKAGTAMDSTKEYAKKAAIGAASGAVLGVVMGALSGGKVGRGAIYGTAVGGGIGLLQPVFERGGNVELPQNAQFDIILDQPITVSANY